MKVEDFYAYGGVVGLFVAIIVSALVGSPVPWLIYFCVWLGLPVVVIGLAFALEPVAEWANRRRYYRFWRRERWN